MYCDCLFAAFACLVSSYRIIHSFVRSFILSCIHIYIRTYIHTYIHTYRQTDTKRKTSTCLQLFFRKQLHLRPAIWIDFVGLQVNCGHYRQQQPGGEEGGLPGSIPGAGAGRHLPGICPPLTYVSTRKQTSPSFPYLLSTFSLPLVFFFLDHIERKWKGVRLGGGLQAQSEGEG